MNIRRHPYVLHACALSILFAPSISTSRNHAIHSLFAAASPTFSTDASRSLSSLGVTKESPILDTRGGSLELATPKVGGEQLQAERLSPLFNDSNDTASATISHVLHNAVTNSTATETLITVPETETAPTSSSEAIGTNLDLVSNEETEAVANDCIDMNSLHNEEKKGGPLKVLFLSADTGGGHRASAESLANQFLRHYPGSEYELLDVWTPTDVYPYKTLVPTYKHLSAHPRQWKLLYHVSNSRPYEIFTNWHSRVTCEEKIRKQMEVYNPDVIISVHPTMNTLPLRISKSIAKKRGKYVPFFTVVTDFGSGHCTWFHKGVDKMYVASKQIRKLAKRRANVPNDKLVMAGLPIRHDFAVQAENMGERHSPEGTNYREMMKERLGLDPKKKMILVMGGGEGVGSLSTITNALQKEIRENGVDATICVVCGRNAELKRELETKDWDAVNNNVEHPKRKKVKNFFKTINKKKSVESESVVKGNVDVVGLGFVTNMAEYMVAADILVSKAGPGTIAEAAALGLPVMITSFLPGQEAGNVDIVLDGGFGIFKSKAKHIASTVTGWMKDDSLIEEMSRNSAKVGNPTAASEIVQDIGTISHEWLLKNKES